MSSTALLVALSVAREGDRFELPGVRFAGAALARAGAGWRVLGWLARHRLGRALLDAVERATLPGLARHHCARKHWIRARLRDAPPSRRTLWIGVGFDVVAGDGIVALDRPAQLAARVALGASGATRALSLPEDADALVALCREAPATLVLEGVAMYVAPRSLLKLLHGVSALPVPPRLVFSALEPTRPGGRGFARASPFVDRWLARRREPFRWRASIERMRDVLARNGYRIDAWWPGAGFGEYVVDATIRP